MIPKKILLLAVLALCFNCLFAQISTVIAHRVEVKDSLKLGNKWYKSLPDSTGGGSSFDSSSSQGGGFHTQNYNDVRYKKYGDTVAGSGYLPVHRLADTAAILRSLVTTGYDSSSSQGGGFHTQNYNDVRYKKYGDTVAGSGYLPVHRLADTAAVLRSLVTTGYDSSSSQGGGFHTQNYNDVRYKKYGDTVAGSGYLPVHRLADTAAVLRSLVTTGYDSSSSQGGGFHTQNYNDVRYKKYGDTVAGSGYLPVHRLADTAAVLRSLVGSGPQTFPNVLATGRTLSNDDSVLEATHQLYLKNGTTKVDSLLATYRTISDSGYYNALRLHNRMILGDSAYTSTRQVIVIGDSWASAYGASRYIYGFGYQVAYRMNAQAMVYGYPGQSLHSMIVTWIGLIPVRNPSLHQLIVLESGINDAGTGVTTAQHTADVTRWADSALARGWAANEIVIHGPGFEGVTHNTTTFPFVAAAQAGAAAAGVIFYDSYTYMKNNGGLNLVSSDSVHPLDIGHGIDAEGLMLMVPYSVQPTGRQLIHGRLAVGGPRYGPGVVNVFGGSVFVDPYYIGPGYKNVGQNFIISTVPDSNLTGNYNFVMSYGGMGSATTATQNAGFGRFVYAALTGGSFNVAAGSPALQNCTTCGNMTALGWGAFNAATTQQNGVAVGSGAGLNAVVDNMTAIGKDACRSCTTSSQMSAVGNSAFYSTSDGASNAGNGFSVFYANVHGAHLSGLGASAFAQSLASEQTGAGYLAGWSHINGGKATHIGSQAGYTDGQLATTDCTGCGSLGYLSQVTQDWSWNLGGQGGSAVRVGIGIPSPTARLHLPQSDGIPGFGALKLSDDSAATTAATGTGTSATLTFSAKPYPPFIVGSKITVSGVSPSGYNGTWTVTACSTTTVTFSSSATGSQTIAGIIEANVLLSTPENGLFERQANQLAWTGRDLTRRFFAFYTVSNSWGAGTTQDFTSATITVADQSTSDSSQKAVNTKTVKQMIAGLTGGVGGSPTNLGQTQNATTYIITSSTGTSATLNTATTSLAGLLDTARARYIDSLRGGLLPSISLGDIGSGRSIQRANPTGDSALFRTILQDNAPVDTTLSGAINLRADTSGIYLPTITNSSNAASITSDSAVWLRSDKTISVDGHFTVTPTSGSANTQVTIVPPISSNITGGSAAFGQGMTSQTANGGVGCVLFALGNNMQLTVYPTGATSAFSVYYHYSYRIR